GAAEIDADDAGVKQPGWLPYCVDGRGRKALPRLPRRTREGEAAARPPARARAAGWPHARQAEDPASAPALELEETDRRRRAGPLRLPRDLGGRGLPRVPERRGDCQQAPGPDGPQRPRGTDAS